MGGSGLSAAIVPAAVVSKERGAGMSRRVILSIVCAALALPGAAALALPGAAGARSLSVRSFDGTKLHVNFFTAVGLRPTPST